MGSTTVRWNSCLRVTAIAILAADAATAATANDAAFGALERALEDCETRARTLGDARFSFHRVVEKENGVRLRARFTPQGASGGSWELIEPAPADASAKVRRAFDEFAGEEESDRKINLREPRRYLHAEFPLSEETADAWIFRGPTIDLSDGSERARNFMKKARDALVTEIVVRKEPARIASVELTNSKAIRPAPLAVIDDFYLRYDFDEAWPGGPIVMRSVRQSVAGHVLIAKFHMVLNVDNAEMQSAPAAVSE
jgi:hypothetical protein